MAFCVCDHVAGDHELGIGDCTEPGCACSGYHEASEPCRCYHDLAYHAPDGVCEADGCGCEEFKP